MKYPLSSFTAALRRSAIATAISLFAFVQPLHAGVTLGSPFGDHMVLQRDRTICVWGSGVPAGTVAITVGTQHGAAVVESNGFWKAFLNPLPAGGPYVLTATEGGATVTAQDVLYGDVWLCAGQSNMQMPVKETAAADQAAAAASPIRLRLATVAKGWNGAPQTTADIKWRPCTPASAADFSAVGYYFAGELLKDPALAKVPIGVIDSSFGGTTCEAWIPQSGLAGCDPQILHDSMFGIKPAMIYNAMIRPLGPASLTAVVWYQGEGNAGQPQTYPKLLSTLITTWRAQFDSPALPFVIIQLPDFAGPWGGYYWSWIRAAQAEVARTLPHTSLVVGIETTDGYNLHPKQKREIGRRTALLVRHDVYHESIAGAGPTLKAVRISPTNIWLTFATEGSRLINRATNEDVRGFAVAGDDGIFHYASARIRGDSVSLECAEVPAPKTVRYAWAGVPHSTLGNEAGVPAAPFRTDDFPPRNADVQPEPVSHEVTTPAYELHVDGDGKVTSLAVQGEQFLSNEPGKAGGTSIPVMFGEKSLAEIENPGPELLTCSDGTVTVSMRFQEEGMIWDITNAEKDELNFNIALSAPVQVSRPDPSGKITLTHKKSTVVIAGIDSVSDAEAGKVLQVVIKGKTSRRIVFDMSAK